MSRVAAIGISLLLTFYSDPAVNLGYTSPKLHTSIRRELVQENKQILIHPLQTRFPDCQIGIDSNVSIAKLDTGFSYNYKLPVAKFDTTFPFVYKMPLGKLDATFPYIYKMPVGYLTLNL
jgi:hypothetical protein